MIVMINIIDSSDDPGQLLGGYLVVDLLGHGLGEEGSWSTGFADYFIS